MNWQNTKSKTISHRPTGVNTSVETWPMTVNRVVDWVLQFKRIGCIAIGQKFVLCPFLDKLLIAMQDELSWQAINKIECMTLAWAIHKGIQAALGPKQNFRFLKQVIADFEIGRAPNLSTMEGDIQARIKMAAGVGSGSEAIPIGSGQVNGKRLPGG